MKNVVLWDVLPCSLDKYSRFLKMLNLYKTVWHHISVEKKSFLLLCLLYNNVYLDYC
jgi:hypothetical protein